MSDIETLNLEYEPSPQLDGALGPHEVDRLQALQAFNARLVCMNIDASAYNEVVKGVWKVIGCDTCALFLFDPRSESLKLMASVGYEDLPANLAIKLDDPASLHAQALREEYLVHLDDMFATPDAQTLSCDLGSNLVFPVISHKGPVGVFDFGSFSAGAFTPEDISMCSMLVDQMAFSLENIRLVREVTASRDAVIRGMALLAEMRDTHIGGHLNRICALARLLAGRLVGLRGYHEVTEDFIDAISRAAALHDVGKVGIPDSILLKPGKLTSPEFEVMKAHTTIGAELLDGLAADFGEHTVIQMGSEVARYHHEWWDGQGYPEKKRERDIPLAARIVGICDVYDALTSRRVYKDAWGHAEAMEAIQGLKGRQFDPILLEKFQSNPEDLHAIQKRFPD